MSVGDDAAFTFWSIDERGLEVPVVFASCPTLLPASVGVVTLLRHYAGQHVGAEGAVSADLHLLHLDLIASRSVVGD